MLQANGKRDSEEAVETEGDEKKVGKPCPQVPVHMFPDPSNGNNTSTYLIMLQ